MTRPIEGRLSLGTLHAGQVKAYWALKPYRFKALRCGRRFGKTDFGKTWIARDSRRVKSVLGSLLSTRPGRRSIRKSAISSDQSWIRVQRAPP